MYVIVSAATSDVPSQTMPITTTRSEMRRVSRNVRSARAASRKKRNRLIANDHPVHVRDDEAGCRQPV
jgi:hypothetical protein